jgi:amidase
MGMKNLTYESALTQSALIADKELSPVELMQSTLDRIDAANGEVNAIVSLRDHEALLAEAKEAETAERKGWLHGIPIAIKDLANSKGLPTSMGSPVFAGEIAQTDDIMVARLKAAGAIVIGKTNTPEFGLGSHTFNPVFGATKNPYDLSRSAGGSSGGAAAALATGMLSVADGSDMMGSLRNPAAWNNVYGMRPSFGLVPSEPKGDTFLHQLATSGPMARTPSDLAALLDTMAGSDPRLPLSIDQDAALPTIDRPVSDLRIGWLGDWDGAYSYEAGIDDLAQTALAQMAGMGWSVSSVSAPFSAPAIWESWITLRSYAVGAGLAPLYEDLDMRAKLKPAAIYEIERGLGFSAMEVHKASVTRSQWFQKAAELFEKYDVLVLPSAQVWPFDVNLVNPPSINDKPMDTYHRWMEVVIAPGLLGLPVVNVPIGFGGADNLPMGLQLIGKRGSDAKLLQISQAWHAETMWPQNHPPAI